MRQQQALQKHCPNCGSDEEHSKFCSDVEHDFAEYMKRKVIAEGSTS